MPKDLAAKALAVVVPNITSMAGCCAAVLSGTWRNCSIQCKNCPLTCVAWHAALLGANSSAGYASYLVWKQLRGFSCPEHCVYSMFLLTGALHPYLLKKCDLFGCTPALINAIGSVGLAAYATHLFMKADRLAGRYMLPGVALALMMAGCTFLCVHKKCCKSTGGGSCCAGSSCCKK